MANAPDIKGWVTWPTAENGEERWHARKKGTRPSVVVHSGSQDELRKAVEKIEDDAWDALTEEYGELGRFVFDQFDPKPHSFEAEDIDLLTSDMRLLAVLLEAYAEYKKEETRLLGDGGVTGQ